MTDEFKQVFFFACLVTYGVIITIVKTSPSVTIVDGFITALIFTVIAVIAYKLSNKP